MYDEFSNCDQYIASSDKKVSDIPSDIIIDMLSDTEHKFFTTIAKIIITKGEVTAADAIKATGQNKGRKYTF